MEKEESEIIQKTKNLIDELKAVCNTNGIGNSPSEYKIITEVFLYKFLNDKFLYEIRKIDSNLEKLSTRELEKQIKDMLEEDYQYLLLSINPEVAKLKKEHFISYLFTHKQDDDFYKLFDDTLIDIANYNIDIFSVRTGGKEKIRLFDGLSQHITETSKKNSFARAVIDKLVNFSFENLFTQKYDAFAIVFEYLIKDYNKDFGKYAEYYTPNSIARIIARILVKDGEKVENVTIYDPSAGSGTLILALANQIGEENCTIYTQDISQKSNEFLRLNLILNNLVHSLGNVVHGNTLLEPAHYNENKSRLAQFNYIVSNPPFKTDFSDYRDELADAKFKDRFFCGVPNIPNKDKDKMAIYLMFIQHILFSLRDDGKAAIVVPTIFLTTDQGRIEKNLRKHLIDNKMLYSVISMPSNIFANTGTNVSVLFLDKSKQHDNILLIDASALGDKIKDGKNQRTVLKESEIESLINICNEKIEKEKFSINVSIDEIKNKNYSLSAGQYFKKIQEYKELTIEEYKIKTSLQDIKLDNIFDTNTRIKEIIDVVYKYWFMQFEFPNKDGKPYKSSNGKMIYNEKIKTDIPEGWEVKKLDEILKKIPTTKKYKTTEYLMKGKYPIIDQSEKNIGGYTNEIDDTLNIEDCIIFGDHTKILKYINFRFARGADGTQIICSNNERLSNILLYMQIKNFQLVSQGYSRYFKFLKEKFVIIPDEETNNNFLNEIERISMQSKKIFLDSLTEKELMKFVIPGLLNGQIKV